MQHASNLNRPFYQGLLATTLALAAQALSAQPSLRQVLLSRATTCCSAGTEALAQPVTMTAPTTTEEALHALAEQADVIFAGEVAAIHHDGGAVRVEWNVLQGLFGVQAGQSFVLREWAGLWANDDARYRVGQRSLVLLHAASVGGFRSPVGGQDGIIPLNGDFATGTTDLRWIAARAAHPDLTGIAAPSANSTFAAEAARRMPTKVSQTTPPTLSLTSASPISNQTVAIAKSPDSGLNAVDANMVMGLLNAWCRRSAK